jgi:TonB family protein
MLGGEQASDPRWVQWLQSAEADAAINNNELIFAWFTDEEFITRKRYCDLSSNECRTPSVRTKKSATHTVAQPDFQLPEVLPPGLADAIAAQNRCSQSWLATASATADRAGRVRDVELHRLQIDNACAATVTALMKLSLVRPVSIASPARANGIILARARRASVCLDESPLSDRAATLMHTGGDVTAPIVKRRVEPNFPLSARVAMSQGGYRTVLVITEATISTTGCVRSLKLLAQSDYPEMNGAAIEALSQWQFEPGRLHGVPVDVIFNLTINFKLGP